MKTLKIDKQAKQKESNNDVINSYDNIEFSVVKTFGYLFIGYKDTMFYWAFIVLYKKSLLSFINSFYMHEYNYMKE